MPRKEGSSKESTPGDRSEAGKYGILWRSFIWFALIAVLFYFFGGFQTQDRVSIPYSVFKQQIVAGNVREVTFSDQQITGRFEQAYRQGGSQNDQAPEYRYFKTNVPSVSDPSLLGLLEKYDVTIAAEPGGSPWLIYGLLSFLPWILLIGYFVYIGNRMQNQANNSSNGGGIFGFGKSKAKRYRKTSEELHFSDVAGMEKVKRDLQEIVDYLKDPQRFTKLGAEIPKGVLLMGAPGTGKTMLAKAVAGEVGVPFFSISGSEFVEMFVGVGASRVRDMFSNAKKNAPSIIFIDEIDSIGRTRGTGIGGAHDEREQTLNQILSEMDGFQPHEAVVVMAATNRPDVLDPALTRPGRFDRQIVIDLPQKQARLGILKIHTRKVPLAGNIDLENIAARTVGFSGAVIKNIVNEAALLAGRKNKKQVEQEDFDQALDKVMLGMEHEEKMVEREKKLIAYHETGHALVAKLIPGADPLQKVTIIPRGRSLGATEQVPEIDRNNLSRSYLESLIAVRLGGHVAEKLVFNDLTNGAADDLKRATKIARMMISQWGMSDKLGPVTFQAGEDHVFLGREMAQPKDFSEHTARLIDEEIGRLIRSIEEQVRDLLQKNRRQLDALAQALLERETLNNKDVDAIIGVPKAERA